ncbi:MAG: hypothetical protein U5L96_20660 [Owenweeksia sp.]|nr:hypothetical protein [Owenweeksia sp.]
MKEVVARISSRNVILMGILFSVLNVGFIVTENFWGLLLPLGLALVASIVLALDKVLLFLVFSTPLSIFYFNPGLHVGFTLPTEPILFGVMLLFFIRLFFEGRFDAKLVRHPVSLAIIFYLFWLLVTSISSAMPVVSIKYFLSQVWFLTVFYFLMSQLLKRRRYIKLFAWLFMLPLAAVVIYTMYVHSKHGFSMQTSTWVMFPFLRNTPAMAQYWLCMYPWPLCLLLC